MLICLSCNLAFYLTPVTKVEVTLIPVILVKMFIQFIAPVLCHVMRSTLLPEYLKKKHCTLL